MFYVKHILEFGEISFYIVNYIIVGPFYFKFKAKSRIKPLQSPC